jgi:hypothetical protein
MLDAVRIGLLLTSPLAAFRHSRRMIGLRTLSWHPWGHLGNGFGAPIGGLSIREGTQKPSLSSAECPEDALIRMRRVSITSEERLIFIRSRENRQQLGKR